MAHASLFENARDTSIYNSNIQLISTNHAHYVKTESEAQKLLLDQVAPVAFYNSATRYDAPKCLEGTREAVINEIMDWIQAPQDGKFDARQRKELVMWVHGAAGAGKSSLAQEIAWRTAKSRVLAASFFWPRGEVNRIGHTHLIATLAYQLQLTEAFPQMKEPLENAIMADRTIFDRALDVQMESLIIQPLKQAFKLTSGQGMAGFPVTPKVIILDGLDECSADEPQVQGYILDAICTAVQEFVQFESLPIPVIFLVVSRSEEQIRDVFNSTPLSLFTRRLALDDTNNYRTNEDIEVFLRHRFNSFKETPHGAHLLRERWPSTQIINDLVQKSSGQFIYADTVIKFVTSRDGRPEDQLKIILGLGDTGEKKPFAALDALYTRIFNSIPAEHLPNVKDIMSFLFLEKGDWTISTIEALLFYRSGDLRRFLGKLHSVLFVPTDSNSADCYLRVFHASLEDFFMDPLRSKELRQDLRIDVGQAHAQLAHLFLRHVLRTLQSEVVPPTFMEVEQHAFTKFVHHTVNSSPTKELLDALSDLNVKRWTSYGQPQGGTYYLAETYAQVLQLSAWFRSKVPRNSNIKHYFGIGGHLWTRHRRSLDAVISSVVKTHFLDSDTRKLQITAAKHPNFGDADPWALWEILGNGKNHENLEVWAAQLGFNPMCLADRLNKDCIRELQKFLDIPGRIGQNFLGDAVHGRMYTALSHRIIEYIVDYVQSNPLSYVERGYAVGAAEGDCGEGPFGASVQQLIGRSESKPSPEEIQKRAAKWAIESLPFYLLRAGSKAGGGSRKLDHAVFRRLGPTFTQIEHFMAQYMPNLKTAMICYRICREIKTNHPLILALWGLNPLVLRDVYREMKEKEQKRRKEGRKIQEWERPFLLGGIVLTRWLDDMRS